MPEDPDHTDRTIDDADEANGEGRHDDTTNDTETRYGDDESPA
jgi:hypothetical protein